MGCPLDVIVVDSNCVTVTSSRSCACKGEMDNTNKPARQIRFIDLFRSRNSRLAVAAFAWVMESPWFDGRPFALCARDESLAGVISVMLTELIRRQRGRQDNRVSQALIFILDLLRVAAQMPACSVAARDAPRSRFRFD